jgi:uncharacterized damage-inducible protein DinB
VNKADLVQLFDYSYWATGQILRTAEELSPEEFVAPSDVTYRNLRGTLVEGEMRTWLSGLDDETLEGIVDLGQKDRFPLYFFLLHIVTHTAQQRRDAAILLERAGHAPPEIDFLDYADASAHRSPGPVA